MCEGIGRHRLKANDSCVIPAGAAYALEAGAGSEILEVTLPAELSNRSSRTPSSQGLASGSTSFLPRSALP